MFAALPLSALGALSLSSIYFAMWLSLSLSLSLCVLSSHASPFPIWQVSPPSPPSSGACTMTQGWPSAPTRRPTAIAPTRSSATRKQTFGLLGLGRVPRRGWTSRRREGGGRWGEKRGERGGVGATNGQGARIGGDGGEPAPRRRGGRMSSRRWRWRRWRRHRRALMPPFAQWRCVTTRPPHVWAWSRYIHSGCGF